MTKEKIIKSRLGDDEVVFKTGKLAPRAESSVLAQMGETVVLAIVSLGKEESSLDYFPLSVEYIEKFYAGGIISGSRFIKRERRPSDDAVLKARQIDHSIRSLFPKGFRREVSVVVSVLAYDEKNNPEALAVVSASMALMNSSVPFNGPSASVLIGIKDGKLILNPKNGDVENLDSEFIVSVKGKDRILNIEGFGDEVEEEKMGELIDFALENIQGLLKVQEEFQKEVGKKKLKYEELSVSQELLSVLEKDYKEEITKALYNDELRDEIYSDIKEKLLKKFEKSEEIPSKASIIEAMDYIARKIMREGVLAEEKRTSGRKLDEIREIDIEVDVLPRVHGSGLFTRGLSQSLSVVTLGSTRLAQTLESFEGEEIKSFMHHYHGPNYSMGQAGRFSYYPGRREIGHGNIGENALRKMVPGTDKFPYTIRVVSEILSQKGSSSMAGATGTSIALMDAGVPIKAPVAGISIGLVTDDKDETKYKLLTDLEDVEDYYGDMDFKVTGTTKGITAIQLDNKLEGVPSSILKAAFVKAKNARLKILDLIAEKIKGPRSELKPTAPRVDIIKISPLKIGELIGPGGKVIKNIIEKSGEGIDIDIQDDGQINITSISEEQRNIAKGMIEKIVAEPEVGKVYEAVVDKLTTYGAFVNVSPSITGLVHVSEMSEGYVKDPSTIVKEGDKIKVKLIKIENGRQSFSMKGV